MRNLTNLILGRDRRGGWLRLPAARATDETVKPEPYLPIYEELLTSIRDTAFTLLELGVWKGHSLEMWRDAFPRATIIGIDLAPPELALGPRVHIVRGDQTDPLLMRRVRDDYAPRGFDVIVDDASHFGVTTARSVQVLYAEHLRPGGMYFIEDWGTGYLPTWQDGGPVESRLDIGNLDRATTPLEVGVRAPIPMPSHDLGLVGVIKRLIDHVASGTVRFAQPDAVGNVLPIESMTVWDGMVLLRKPSA